MKNGIILVSSNMSIKCNAFTACAMELVMEKDERDHQQ